MIKIKGCRRNREDVATGRKVELTPKCSSEYSSYHSHHHIIPDSLPTQNSNKKSTGKGLLASSGADRSISSKAVVFSSKSHTDFQPRKPPEEIPRKQTPAFQAKAPNEDQKFGAKRKTATYSSKLVQTSSSISNNTVSFRSVAVGVSGTDLCQQKSCRAYQSRPSSRSAWPGTPTPPPSRRAKVPGSCVTISSAWYSRTESSMLAALEAPPASHRHARCMVDQTYLNPPSRKSTPVKKNRPNASPTRDTMKRKQQVAPAKTKIS